MEVDIDRAKPVLIVDDDEVVLRVLGVILKKNGFLDVREAVDGQKALIQLMNYRPSLVITDIDMPVMNGLQLMKQIRRQYKFDNVPVLALTANDTKEIVVKALTAGVDSYLIKEAICEQELIQKIDEAFIHRRQKLQNK
ncbi:MAG: response regulator [Proteobacteria bacterium]|nr:response regulator [Pseudomonadota bacterium]